MLPYIVEIDEPVEELGVLHRGQVAREGLVEMVMGVHEARERDVARRVDDVRARGDGEVGPDPRDAAAVDEDVDARALCVGAERPEAVPEQDHLSTSALKSPMSWSSASPCAWRPPQ
jgi:hypothetical protein